MEVAVERVFLGISATTMYGVALKRLRPPWDRGITQIPGLIVSLDRYASLVRLGEILG